MIVNHKSSKSHNIIINESSMTIFLNSDDFDGFYFTAIKKYENIYLIFYWEVATEMAYVLISRVFIFVGGHILSATSPQTCKQCLHTLMNNIIYK